MFVLGLTGSIGMGKSTVAGMFQAEGVPVWSADEAVHKLYGPGGAAVGPVGDMFEGVVVDGGIDRGRLGRHVVGNEEAMKRLEAAVHPLVGQEREAFLQAAHAKAEPLVVLDIPLLFETKAESQVDAVAVVSAGAEAQRERVLARPGMTPEKFEAILGRQVPDEVKRRMADFTLDTSCSVEETRGHVGALIKATRGRRGTSFAMGS